MVGAMALDAHAVDWDAFAEGDKGRGAGMVRFPREEMDALVA